MSGKKTPSGTKEKEEPEEDAPRVNNPGSGAPDWIIRGAA